MSDKDNQPLDPTLFGEGQARDDRFEVRDRWKDLVNPPPGTPEYTREFLHRQMNEEANVMEQAAQSLVDFPDADWDIRMWLARQCSDEARHTCLYQRLMERSGVRVGERPVLNFQYKVLSKIDTLIGRLAVENRTFEADGLDAATFGETEARANGDTELAEVLEFQQADEILHVGFANEWIGRQVRMDPSNVMKIARAVSHADRAFRQVFAGGQNVRYPVAETERLAAGFDPAEIEVAKKLSKERQATGGSDS